MKGVVNRLLIKNSRMIVQCQEGSFCEGAFLQRSLQYLKVCLHIIINELEGWCLGTLGRPLDPPLL